MTAPSTHVDQEDPVSCIWYGKYIFHRHAAGITPPCSAQAVPGHVVVELCCDFGIFRELSEEMQIRLKASLEGPAMRACGVLVTVYGEITAHTSKCR